MSQENRGEQSQQNDQNQQKPRRRYYSRNRNYNKKRTSNRPDQQKVSFKRTSVVIPLLNEEESLTPLLIEIKKAFFKVTCDYEVLFIDDGSTDKSLEVIKRLAKENNKIRYISFKKNYGKSAALQLGFKAAKGDAIITMDAELGVDTVELLKDEYGSSYLAIQSDESEDENPISMGWVGSDGQP